MRTTVQDNRCLSYWILNPKSRSSPNDFILTAGGVQETELKAQTKHCSAKREKYVMVSKCRWQWASRSVMVDNSGQDASWRFHYPRAYMFEKRS